MRKLLISLALAVCVLLALPQAQALQTYSGTCSNGLTWELDDEWTLIISGTGPMEKESNGKYAWEDYCKNLARKVVVKAGVTTVGENAFSSYKDVQEVVLPSTVTEIGYGAFYSCSALERINLPAGVQRMEGMAFSNCEKLAAVEIPQGITAIEFGTFEGCAALTEIVIPDSVKILDDRAFQNCRALASITLPDGVENIGYDVFRGTPWDTALPDGVTYVGKTLYRCKGTCPQVLEIREGTVSVAGNACNGCTGITKVIMPDSMHTVEDYAFAGCTSLAEVELSAALKTIGYQAFARTKLKALVLPNALEEVGQEAFSGCASLETVYIPQSVTSLGRKAFYGCTGLKGVYIDDLEAWCGIEFKYVDSLDGTENYASCNPLYYAGNLYVENRKVTQLQIPETVNQIPDMAFVGGNMSEVIIPGDLEKIGMLAFGYCKGLQTVEIQGKLGVLGGGAFENASVKKVYIADCAQINRYAFNLCYALESVVLPGNMTAIEENTFYKCEKLKSLTIPETVVSIHKTGLQNMTSMETLYYAGTTQQWNSVKKAEGWDKDATWKIICLGDYPGDQNLEFLPSYDKTYYTVYSRGDSTATELVIPGVYNGLPVKEIDPFAFWKCTDLVSVTIPGTVTDVGNDAFSKCSGLEWAAFLGDCKTTVHPSAFVDCSSLTLVEFKPNMHLGDGVFENCVSLKEITLPGGLTQIDYDLFKGCTALERVGIPAGVFSIGYSAFEGCSSLEGIVLPEELTGMGTGVFKDCTALKYIRLPDKLQQVENRTFMGCSALETVDLPAGLLMVGEDAFNGCSSLTRIDLPGNVREIGAYAFQNCTALSQPVLPEGLKSIGYCAFANCSNLQTVAIPVSVTEMSYGAFGWIDRLTVEYAGTASQWNAKLWNRDWATMTDYTLVCLGSEDAGTKEIFGSTAEAGVKLDPAAVEELIGENMTAVIFAEDGRIVLDTEVLEELAAQADGETITVIARKIEDSALNSDQKAVLAQKNVQLVLTLEAYAGDAIITDFGGGKVRVCVPYALQAGQDPENIYVAYIAADGRLEQMPTQYADGMVSFETTHFSEYAVLEKKTAASIGGVNYETLSAALAEVKAGQTVVLQEAAKVGSLVLPKGVGLDLNGYALEADFVVAFAGAELVDSVGTGLLKCRHVKLDTDNSMLPVWVETDGGYRFFTMKDSQLYLSQSESGFVFIAKPVLGKAANAPYMALAGNGLSVKARMSWKSAGGNDVEQFFVLKGEDVQSIYSDKNQIIQLTVNGAGSYIGRLSTTMVIESDTGVIWAGVPLLYTGN